MRVNKDTFFVSDGWCQLVSGRTEKASRFRFTFVATMRCEHDGEAYDQRIDFM
jgi:hypothetical protein